MNDIIGKSMCASEEITVLSMLPFLNTVAVFLITNSAYSDEN